MVITIRCIKFSHSLLIGLQKSSTTLEDSLVISGKTKHSLTIWIIIQLVKPIECTIPRVNCRVNFGLQVIMMFRQCRFINCKKGTSLVGDADSGKTMMCVGRSIWEHSFTFPSILLWTLNCPKKKVLKEQKQPHRRLAFF